MMIFLVIIYVIIGIKVEQDVWMAGFIDEYNIYVYLLAVLLWPAYPVAMVMGIIKGIIESGVIEETEELLKWYF